MTRTAPPDRPLIVAATAAAGDAVALLATIGAQPLTVAAVQPVAGEDPDGTLQCLSQLLAAAGYPDVPLLEPVAGTVDPDLPSAIDCDGATPAATALATFNETVAGPSAPVEVLSLASPTWLGHVDAAAAARVTFGEHPGDGGQAALAELAEATAVDAVTFKETGRYAGGTERLAARIAGDRYLSQVAGQALTRQQRHDQARDAGTHLRGLIVLLALMNPKAFTWWPWRTVRDDGSIAGVKEEAGDEDTARIAIKSRLSDELVSAFTVPPLARVPR